MAHELCTRSNRRVLYVSYDPLVGDEDDDEELLGTTEDLNNGGDSQRTYDLKDVNWFYRVMVMVPINIVLVLAKVVVLIGVCGGLCWKFHPIPDFSQDPTKGFETRRTPIQSSAHTLSNLYHRLNRGYYLQPNKSLVLNSLGLNSTGMLPQAIQWLPSRPDPDHEPPRTRMKRSYQTYGCQGRVDPSDPEFGYLTKEDFKFLIKPTAEGDLLSLENLCGMCKFQQTFLRPYTDYPTEVKSIPTFLLALRLKNMSDCDALTQEDVDFLHGVIKKCGKIYARMEKIPIHPLTLNHGQHVSCSNRFVYSILSYMLPAEFVNASSLTNQTNVPLTYALSYIYCQTILDAKNFYEKHLVGRSLQNEQVRIVAVNLFDHDRVKYSLFATYLLEDAEFHFILAMVIVLLIMWAYLRSVVLMIATVLNVAMSFVLAYFIYYFALQMKFFPFINILVVLVLIAVGADDVFIFYDTWQQTIAEFPDMPLPFVMQRTFKHAALSIFVTSLTTASAFFANVVSNITCIQCFGIFAGMAIIANSILMILWIPLVIGLLEIVSRRLSKAMQPCTERLCKTFSPLIRSVNACLECCTLIFTKCLPTITGKAWFVWVFILLAMGIGSCFVVFVSPKLNLPKSKDFQLFPDSNLLENWDLNYKDKFPYQINDPDKQWNDEKLPMYFIWGFEPSDGGNRLNPDNKGKVIVEDPLANFYSLQAQEWLTKFCVALKNVSFVQSYHKVMMCPFDYYAILLQKVCSQPSYRPLIEQCCVSTKTPFNVTQLELCWPGIVMLDELNIVQASSMGSPIFRADNSVAGFMFFVRTNLENSFSYESMNGNYKQVKEFFDLEQASAPAGLQTGFFSAKGYFMFYDLQRAIAVGTYYSIGLSLGMAFLVMLLASLNILITIYAIVTISFAILGTVASIVLMGWHLNIVESITISLAVGLSIDYTLHYGVAYRLSRAYDPVTRVKESFTRVGSAVAMAALTTFLAGAAIMPSRVLAYIKLGTFLMLVMTFSWIYSTLFFQSLCRIIGPRGNFCQISTLCKKKCSSSNECDDDGVSVGSTASDDSLLVTF